MPVILLTDRFVRTAKPQPGHRQTEYFDEATKGFSLLASAGARTFYLAYTRRADGRRMRVKLGAFPDLTLAAARQKAREARAAVGEGSDPATERRAEQVSFHVRDLVENYVIRHAATQRSGRAIARRLRKNVSGVIGDLTLAKLHRRDLTRCIDAVKDRGATVEANRVFEDLRAMVRWARGRGDLDENLMEGMRRPTEPVVRDRVLTADEIRAFWAGLDNAAMAEGTRRVLRLCLVTAARVGEVAGMTTDEIDLDRRIWTIPAARSKNARAHALPLSGLAIEIIEAQLAEVARARRKAEGPHTPAYVFPGHGARAPITVFGVVGAIAYNRARFGIEPFTSHDLRRTAATEMEAIGVSPFIVAHVLGHVSVTKASVTSKVYARYDYASEKRKAVEQWAARLQGIIEGAAAVLPISA